MLRCLRRECGERQADRPAARCALPNKQKWTCEKFKVERSMMIGNLQRNGASAGAGVAKGGLVRSFGLLVIIQR